MSIKKRMTTGPPSSYARLKYLTSSAFGFRDPEVFLIAKEVRQVVDVVRSGGHMDLNSILVACAEDVIEHSKGQAIEVR